jgi:hypothetical protein
VELFWCQDGQICGLAIRDMRAQMLDFRACAEDRLGPEQCLVVSHRDRRARGRANDKCSLGQYSFKENCRQLGCLKNQVSCPHYAS